MKKNLIRLFLLLFYCIPYLFLSMNEDVTKGTLWFHLLTIISLSALCFFVIKVENIFTLIAGNVLSYLSSYTFIRIYQTEKWLWYFKPFTAYSLLMFLSIIVFIIKILVYICLKRRDKS